MDYYSTTTSAADAAAVGFTSLFSSICCCGLYIIPLIIGVLFFAIWLYMLVQVLTREESSFNDKNGKVIWLLVVLLGGGIGAIIYYFVEHRKYKEKNP